MEITALRDESTVVIFTSAPAGLGHLRVTNSLSEALPKDIQPILLGSQDASMEGLHKFMSVNSVARGLMEWMQEGSPQKYFTRLYRNYLRSNSSYLIKQFKDILEQRLDVPKRAVVVATHFGLAHQIAQVKNILEKETGVDFTLVVQVTDDSPQNLWYVEGADIIFVPSWYTKRELEDYGRSEKLAPVKFKVLPYPISPMLDVELSHDDFKNRKAQLQRFTKEEIHMSLPVSGAAVDMLFYDHLIGHLIEKYPKFVFHIVSKDVPFTKAFLKEIERYPNIKLYASTHDREVVDFYDGMYKESVISIEITKPSEQAFKCLYNTKKVGGSVLLFTNPVGRQEYDNLKFLRRHGLIFGQDETAYLLEKSENKQNIGDFGVSKIFENKGKIRGLELPLGSQKCADFIWWALQNGIFEQMVMQGAIESKQQDLETRSDGAKLFWDTLDELVV